MTGPPGAGKSSLAARVVRSANEGRPSSAVVAPMDGFHLSDERLRRVGLLQVKGAPETFDVDGFRHLLERVRTETEATVRWPDFDRAREETVPDAIAITPATRLVVVEGNYLLLDRPGWREARSLLDEVWYVDAPRAELRERLLSRCRAGGRTEAEAVQHVDESDLRNADLVAATKAEADRVLRSTW